MSFRRPASAASGALADAPLAALAGRRNGVVTMPIKLGTLAHGRSGDKGNHANVPVLPYTPAGYAWLREHLTADAVRRYFGRLGPSRVERYEAPNVLGLNFVLYEVLGGGASRSLRTDTQGKTLALALLNIIVPVPVNYASLLRPTPGTGS